MENVFSFRLSAARTMRGMSAATLARNIGKSREAVYKYEKGLMLPDSTSVISIAKALNVPIDYLFRSMSISIHNIEFRKKSKLGEKKEKAIKEEVKDCLERYLEIEGIYPLTTHNTSSICAVDVHDEMDVYSVAQRIRNDWNLGDDGISNVIEVLEEHNIRVIEVDEVNAFDGLSGYADNNIPVIVVNANFVSERKRFTALHELGHLLLSFSKHIEEKKREILCNLFANEMLIPRTIFLRKIGANRRDISLYELIDLQKQYGISIDALMYKAQSLNVITPKRYTTFRKKKNVIDNFKMQVEKSRSEVEHPVRFERLVYHALADETISISKASELLGKSINSIRKELAFV